MRCEPVSPPPSASCTAIGGGACVLPFEYNGNTYEECIGVDNGALALSLVQICGCERLHLASSIDMTDSSKLVESISRDAQEERHGATQTATGLGATAALAVLAWTLRPVPTLSTAHLSRPQRAAAVRLEAWETSARLAAAVPALAAVAVATPTLAASSITRSVI
jgi:hypothetical protein